MTQKRPPDTSWIKMATVREGLNLTVVRDFLRAFVRAMGDRDNHLKAYRDLAIGIGVLLYAIGVMALAQWLDTP